MNTNTTTIKPAARKAAAKLAADFENAQLLIDQTHLHGSYFLLGQILTGWQLHNIKNSLGFRGPGRPPKNSATVAELRGSLSWAGHLEAKLTNPGTGKAFSERTANNLIQVFHAAKARLRKLGGQSKALALFGENPSKLSKAKIEGLRHHLAKIFDGTSQRQLLEDWSLTKSSHRGGGGARDGEGDCDSLSHRQLAFAFMAPAVREIKALRSNPKKLREYLHSLPLRGQPDSDKPFGLEDLLSHVKDLAGEVESQLKKKKARK